MRRRDSKGALLKPGERQRKDGRYEYRYSDFKGQRHSVYAQTLKDLRETEDKIELAEKRNEDYSAGKINTIQLVERYVSIRQGVRYNTKVGFSFVKNLIAKEDFAYRPIRDIKVSDAKLWFVKLHNDGKGYSTLTSVRGVLKPAFDMAYEEEIIHKNPFEFKITTVVANDSEHRLALTDEQLETWMEYIRTDTTYSKYYDEFVVLKETGMRVSEFCGLTLKDVDLENRRVNVDHQLVRERGGKYYIEETKTKSGKRYIPMTNTSYIAFSNLIKKRPRLKIEPIIDGYTGFLLIDKKFQPKVALHIENECRWAQFKYNKLYPDKPLPHITPHVFRHTFCTNMAKSGLDVKSLQYLMGHSDVGVTMNVYTHASYETALAQFSKLTPQLTPDAQRNA